MSDPIVVANPTSLADLGFATPRVGTPGHDEPEGDKAEMEEAKGDLAGPSALPVGGAVSRFTDPTPMPKFSTDAAPVPPPKPRKPRPARGPEAPPE